MLIVANGVTGYLVVSVSSEGNYHIETLTHLVLLTFLTNVKIFVSQNIFIPNLTCLIRAEIRYDLSRLDVLLLFRSFQALLRPDFQARCRRESEMFISYIVVFLTNFPILSERIFSSLDLEILPQYWRSHPPTQYLPPQSRAESDHSTTI